MKKIILITSCVLVVSLLSFAPFNINPEQKSTKTVKEGIYTYEIVEDDPLGMRLYTLANGLKIYLSVNKDEPRIQTTIAVKAGSTYDPSDATGLAHYLEHMLFKGSGDIGTKDWEAEKVLLEQISDLYELHKNTVDPDKKISIYKKIDSISYLASELAIANEYDKMAASIGATGTNAWTSFEQTVYTNNIPSNELEKWLMLERERFSMLVLRLFHTELEAVYEEFNRSQDNDGRKVRKEMLAGLFQQHKYGKQTTLGTSDHLKNPSMVKIHEYFDTYYVPNNMAICLSGDLNPLKTVQLIDKYFGTMEAKEVPPLEEVEEKPIRRIITKNVLGPSREGVTIAFRFDGKNSDDEMMITLVDMMLNNAAAGIIDLDLVQQQKVLSAGSYPSFMNDYGMQVLWGNPREGQTLEEVRDLLLGALEKIKKGDFEESMISVVGKNLRLLRIQTEETNGIAYDYVDAFTSNTPWEDYINFLDNLIAIRKSEVVEFVNKRFKDNYVIVYKRTGEDPQVAKVVKPAITPIYVNREDESSFLSKFNEMQSKELTPKFVNYQASIDEYNLISGIKVDYIENKTNGLFELTYIIDMGTDNDPMMGLAAQYIQYLGTKKLTAAELAVAFYSLGISTNISATRDRIYISMDGLDESFSAGVSVFEHYLKNLQPDEDALKNMIDGILKSREDAKLSKGNILRRGMLNYAKYGTESPLRNIMSEEELHAVTTEKLMENIKRMMQYKHRIFYYGKTDPLEVLKVLNEHHKISKKGVLAYPLPVTYTQLEMKQDQVYFVNYDMVQAEFMMVAKDKLYDPTLAAQTQLFNAYFGSGLSSIVFQEIRESKGLAYSSWSRYSTPRTVDESHYITSYIGTQADKLPDAVNAIKELMDNMPVAPMQYDAAKESVMKKIASQRTTKSAIFWSYENAKRHNMDYDIRQDIYEAMRTTEITDLIKFHESHIQGRNYTFLVIGSRDKVDMDFLKSLGEFKELTLEDVFNY